MCEIRINFSWVSLSFSFVFYIIRIVMCCNSFNIIFWNKLSVNSAHAKIYAKYQAAASPGAEFKFCARPNPLSSSGEKFMFMSQVHVERDKNMRGSEIRTVLHNQINNCRNNIKAAPSYCFNAQRLYVSMCLLLAWGCVAMLTLDAARCRRRCFFSLLSALLNANPIDDTFLVRTHKVIYHTLHN